MDRTDQVVDEFWKLPASLSQVTILGELSESHSVLDAQLKALCAGEVAAPPDPEEANWDHRGRDSPRTLEPEDLEEIIENLSMGMGEQISVVKTKGPNSIPGTGSSIASASDYSEVSDFESDSGIETSNADVVKLKVSTVSSLRKKKGVKASVDGRSSKSDQSPDGVEVTQVSCPAVDGPEDTTQSTSSTEGLSTEGRIDTLIRCMDHKVDKDRLTKEALHLLLLIPDGYIPLPHQVGGQKHVDGRLGFLRRVGQKDIVYKPAPPPKGLREITFYKSIFCSHFDEVPQDVTVLRELVPEYHGMHEIVDRAGEIHKFIKLEDVVTRFHKPCIMDVKVGRRVWDDFANSDKIDKEKRKYPLQEIIGFRVTGMRVYRSSHDDYIFYDKEYKRSLSVNGALEALRKFFVNEDTNRSDVLGPVIERLYYFVHWMERQKLFKLFATSLLIVYEGDTSRPIRKPRDLLDIRLVDFAHAYERNPKDFNEPDYNTLFGLQNLIKYLEQLRTGDNSSSSNSHYSDCITCN